MYIYVSLLVAIIGAFVYLASTNPKAAEMGRICFGVGTFVFLLLVGGTHSVPFLRP